jgi:branched-chain amino acid transport system substrate-binding protein
MKWAADLKTFVCRNVEWKKEARMRVTAGVVMKVMLLVCMVPSFLSTVDIRPLQASEPIRIGAVFSVTGPAGFIGTPERDAVVAVVDDVNRKGGVLGRQVELYVEDDVSNPTNAVIAATKLIRDRKVSAIIGPSINDSGMAMIPVCEQEQVPFVVTGPILTPLKKWIFIVGAGDFVEASNFLAFTIRTLHAKRIAVLHDTRNYGSMGAKVINQEVGQYPGVELVTQEKLEVTDTNMIPQLTNIKAAKPDLIILWTNGPPAAVVAKNYKQLGMTTQVAGSPGIAVPEFLKISGSIAEESRWILKDLKTAIAQKLPPDDPYRKNIYEPFRKLLKERYGESKEVLMFHGLGHDGIQIVLEALRAAGSDSRPAIRDALEKTVRYTGLIAPFACSADYHMGSRTAITVPIVVKNGEYVPYEGQ